MNLLPNAELFFLSGKGAKRKLVKKAVHDLFGDKDVLIVAVCGAYTPPCTEMVKEYESLYDTFIKETNSKLAKKILDNFSNELKKFKQIS